jgi:hypothetical protein
MVPAQALRPGHDLQRSMQLLTPLARNLLSKRNLCVLRLFTTLTPGANGEFTKTELRTRMVV